jgi:tyrosyl-tRNA synthetase
MSKSLGNYVGVQEAPREAFGKLMSITDDLMWRYYLLCTGVSTDGIEEMKRLVREGQLHPKKAKEGLAMRVVADFHGEAAARQALEEFERIFRKGGVPDEIVEKEIAVEGGRVALPKLVVTLGLASSNSDAMRLVNQGGVRLDDAKVEPGTRDIEAKAGTAVLVKVGKRHFARAKFV